MSKNIVPLHSCVTRGLGNQDRHRYTGGRMKFQLDPLLPWKRRAFFTSYIHAYPFLEAVRSRTNGQYQGFCLDNGYVIMW